MTATAMDCERISPEFLDEERAVLGAMWFRQEFLCEFVDNGSGVFDRDLVESAIDDSFSPVEGF